MLRVEPISRACALVLIVGGSSIVAAPAQTGQPGQMTQARVWVQNRGRAEAVPVELREVNLDTPLKVQVINGDPGFSRINPVQVAESRKMWDYETITLKPADDVAQAMSAKGTIGWETTGIAFVGADGATKLLLKRPR